MPFDSALARSLYAHAPLATFIVDVDPSAAPENRFRFAGWNPACAHLTGLSDEATQGRTPRDLVPWMPEEAALAIEERYQSCVDAGEPIRYEEELLLDGCPTVWLTSLAPVVEEDGTVSRLIGMSDEITSYKRLEACLAEGQAEQARFARRLRQLHRISTTRYSDAEQLADDYLATGAEILGLPIGIVSRIEGACYTVRAAVTPDDSLPAGTTFPLGDTLCADVVHEGSTVHYHDIGLVGHLSGHPAYEGMGLQAYVSTPIRVAGEVYGTLNFSHTEPRQAPFTDQDVELIELMADGIGHFLELEQARQATDAARREAELARDEAEAASRAKSAFLSTMSHEIRTPLTGVLGFAALLRSDDSLPAQQRHYAEVIGRSGDQLVALINDVLDIARIEADALALHVEPTDLPTLVRDSLELHATRAEDHGVEVGYEIASGVPSLVLADGRRVRQVLGNLVSNAVKFTRDGEVTVRVAAEPVAAEPIAPSGRALLRFEVEDTGAGIGPKALPHIFDSFYQADGSAAREHAGTGLGLSICQKLVEAMGGTISAESTLGRGTTVTFTIEVGVQAERQVVVASRPSVRLGGRRALVLDSAETNRELIQALLRQWDVEVALAGSGSDALRLAATEGPFDVALIEHSLPGETGVDVARQLALRGERVPVVLMSAVDEDFSDSEPSIRALLRKPIDTQALRRALRRALTGRPLRPVTPQPVQPVPLPADALLPHAPQPPSGDGMALFSTPAPEVPAVVVTEKPRPAPGIRVMVAEDDATNRDLIRLVLNGLGVHPDFAVNGLDLLEKLEADSAYDLIFMDMMMPEMDGMDAAREVIARYGDDRPRMVALTARALQEDRKRVLAGGLDAFIPKPFSREDLRQALETTPRRAFAPDEGTSEREVEVSVAPAPESA